MPRKTGKIVRIPIELDMQIRNFAINNKISYSDAGREIAKLNNRFKGKYKILKELRF